MDRMIIYPGAIPLDTDLLNVQRGTMKAIGFLAQACLGTNTVLDGLACTPTIPASMAVTVGPGSVTALGEVDASGYGSLGADPSSLVKMGLVETPTTFGLSAPTAPGQSVNYLIEAAFVEQDAVPVVLPYYNAADPSQGYAGANNSGSSQYTQRLQTVALQLKAGASAGTGTQQTPAVDPGYVPVAVITVAAGQGAITGSSIAVPAAAPFLAHELPDLSFAASVARSGWQRMPSGLIVQWGSGVTATGNLDSYAFPLAFPNAVLSMTVSEAAASGWRASGTAPAPTLYGVNQPTATGFQVSCCSFTAGSNGYEPVYNAGSGFFWMALGH